MRFFQFKEKSALGIVNKAHNTFKERLSMPGNFDFRRRNRAAFLSKISQ